MALTTAQAAAILNSGGNTSKFTAATWAALKQVESANNQAAQLAALGAQISTNLARIDTNGNPINSGGGGGAPPPAAYDPAAAMAAQTAALIANQNLIEAGRIQQGKDDAFATLNSMFATYGIDTAGTGLAAQMKSWIQGGMSTDWVKLEIQKTAAYNNRFTGMARLNSAGHHMTEAEYIANERAYTNVMTQWDLPRGFYDDPTDFGNFIANGVSVKELDDRISGAKTFLDQNAPASYKQALQSMYGISEGGMLAYVLDGNKAQSVIEKQMKAAEFSGAAALNGFNLNATQAERYGATLGAQYDAFGADARSTLEANLANVGKDAKTQARLAAIDKEQYTATDALDAAVMNDASKQTASQARVQREQSRFNGSSAVSTATFGRNSGV